ncbi:MAG: LPP20 family lipoprotein [Proteobacteria bacterium]|nr:LPP20 family lipoprotein [Pseudomonadota bacterium]MDA0909297.1 LPP20 family lipoprotein [Pseudomonadota bacterium]MDA1319629.1 LPP20 family lipoprotein [Pseudomonadota bacterium]
MMKLKVKPLAMFPLVALLGACQVPVILQSDGATSAQLNSTSLTDLDMSQTESLAAVKEVLDAKADQIPTLSAVGYAVISSQPGRTDAQKRLMAIRAARMAAMRDLAEQIHGLQVDSSTTVIDLMVQNDTFRGIVTGTIRGARTVRINPTGSDTYEIVLEIDRDMIAYLMDSARRIG